MPWAHPISTCMQYRHTLHAAPTGAVAAAQVLFNINGRCKPGEMLALMGPSGGGKTSLLSILGGRAPKATRPSGEVLFNGSKLGKRVKRQIGFVLQVQAGA